MYKTLFRSDFYMSKKTREQIKYNMSRVKNKNSKIELMLRKELWSRGLRYRKNVTTFWET